MSFIRSHRHKRRSDVGLVITDRIVRSEYCVRIALLVPREDPHLDRLLEALHNLGLCRSRRLHPAVAVAVAPCPLHDAVDHTLLHLIIERSIGLPSHLAEEPLLHIRTEVLLHCLLGISLHLRIDGSVDPETVSVDVILCSVRLHILVEPSVKLVVSPKERVDNEVLVLAV